jgi:hypothetical protein
LLNQAFRSKQCRRVVPLIPAVGGCAFSSCTTEELLFRLGSNRKWRIPAISDPTM